MDEEKILNQEETEAPRRRAIVLEDDNERVEIPIVNQRGEEIGIFRFNPTDINIVNRYNEVADKFEEAVQPLINANISANGEGDDKTSVELLDEAADKMIELMDYVLDGNSREAFFKKTHVFTPMGGKFYCEKVYEAIGKFIEQEFDEEVKKLNTRVSKHTHGYRTGKHKRGDR